MIYFHLYFTLISILPAYDTNIKLMLQQLALRMEHLLVIETSRDRRYVLDSMDYPVKTNLKLRPVIYNIGRSQRITFSKSKKKT